MKFLLLSVFFFSHLYLFSETSFELQSYSGVPIIRPSKGSYYWKYINDSWAPFDGSLEEIDQEGVFFDVLNLDSISIFNGTNLYDLESSRGWFNVAYLGQINPFWLTIGEVRNLFPEGFRDFNLHYNSNYPHFEITGTQQTSKGTLSYFIVFSIHLDAPLEIEDRLDVIFQYEYARYWINDKYVHSRYFEISFDFSEPIRPAFYFHLDFKSPKEALVTYEDYIRINSIEADPYYEKLPYGSFDEMLMNKAEKIASAILDDDFSLLDRWQLSSGKDTNGIPFVADGYAPPAQKLSAIMEAYGKSNVAKLLGIEFDLEAELERIENNYVFTRGESAPDEMRVFNGSRRRFGP